MLIYQRVIRFDKSVMMFPFFVWIEWSFEKSNCLDGLGFFHGFSLAELFYVSSMPQSWEVRRLAEFQPTPGVHQPNSLQNLLDVNAYNYVQPTRCRCFPDWDMSGKAKGQWNSWEFRSPPRRLFPAHPWHSSRGSSTAQALCGTHRDACQGCLGATEGWKLQRMVKHLSDTEIWTPRPGELS